MCHAHRFTILAVGFIRHRFFVFATGATVLQEGSGDKKQDAVPADARFSSPSAASQYFDQLWRWNAGP